MEKDMTVGSPAKMILNFTIPIFLGNVFQQFYSMADTIIVGKFVGTKALAAVGCVGTIMFLILGFLMGLTAGFTVLTSQRFGAKDYDAMRKTVGNAYVLSFGIAAFITLASMLLMKPLLIFMNTPEDIFADAYHYIMIICGGILVQTAYNLFASVLRAIGNSKVPLYFLLLASALNIGLDLVFIICFKMGAPGAAWATVLAQGISALLCYVYIQKKVPMLHLHKEDYRMDGHITKIQLGIGLPMAFQYSITAIGTMMVQSSLNILGSIAVAAYTAATKIEQVITQAFVALGTAMTNYCAQNRGAGKMQRIHKGFMSATFMGVIYSMAASLIFYFVGKYMTILFVSENLAEVMSYTDTYLKTISFFIIPLMVVNLYRNGIQGLGYGLLPMTAGIAELVGRGVIAMIAAHYKSYFGICMASPTAWVMAAVLLLVMYWWIWKNTIKGRN